MIHRFRGGKAGNDASLQHLMTVPPPQIGTFLPNSTTRFICFSQLATCAGNGLIKYQRVNIWDLTDLGHAYQFVMVAIASIHSLKGCLTWERGNICLREKCCLSKDRSCILLSFHQKHHSTRDAYRNQILDHFFLSVYDILCLGSYFQMTMSFFSRKFLLQEALFVFVSSTPTTLNSVFLKTDGISY